MLKDDIIEEPRKESTAEYMLLIPDYKDDIIVEPRKESTADKMAMVPAYFIFFSGIYGLLAYIFDFALPMIFWIPFAFAIFCFGVCIIGGIWYVLAYIFDLIFCGGTMDE